MDLEIKLEIWYATVVTVTMREYLPTAVTDIPHLGVYELYVAQEIYPYIDLALIFNV